MSFLSSLTRTSAAATASSLLRPLVVVRPFSLSSALLEAASAATSQKSKILFVGGLNFDTTRAGLQAPFQEYGHVKNTTIVTHRDTGRSRGFGYIEYESESDAEKALQELADVELDGFKLRLDFALPRAEPDSTSTAAIPADPSSTLYFGNIPNTLDEAQLREALAGAFGAELGLGEINLPTPSTGFGFGDSAGMGDAVNRGFAFLKFDDEASATAFKDAVAAKAEEGWSLEGRVPKIGYERARKPDGFRSNRGGGGGFGGGRGGGGAGFRSFGGRGDRESFGGRDSFGGGQRRFDNDRRGSRSPREGGFSREGGFRSGGGGGRGGRAGFGGDRDGGRGGGFGGSGGRRDRGGDDFDF